MCCQPIYVHRLGPCSTPAAYQLNTSSPFESYPHVRHPPACSLTQESALMALLQQRTLNVIASKQTDLLSNWTAELESTGLYRNIKPEEFRQQTAEFVRLLIAGASRTESGDLRSEEHTSELQSRENLVCRLLL